MADGRHGQTPLGYIDQAMGDRERPQIPGITYEPPDLHDDYDFSPEEDGIETPEITDEDAHSLIGVSISRAATHYTSAKTPALEKAAVLEDWPGANPVESDEEITPSATPGPAHIDTPILDSSGHQSNKSSEIHVPGLSLGNLPSPEPELTLPSPWHAGPKPLVIERGEASRSILREALAAPMMKRRSLSGSGDAIRKFLPSMPNVGQYIPSLPSPSFFSSSNTSKASAPRSRIRGFSTSNTTDSPMALSPRKSIYGVDGAHGSDPSLSGSVTRPSEDPELQHLGMSPHVVGSPGYQVRNKRQLRRVASDESMLYHTTSRASSLGDDTRFENHHDMINSRVKAIRDSLQDRSSFRLPSLPSLPNLPSMPRVPTLSGAMSYLTTGTVLPKLRLEADFRQGFLPLNDKKRPSAIPNPSITPGMVGASISRPDAVIENIIQVTEGNTGLLDRAIENLTGDVVIMGGYRGSILRSAKPPHRQLWVPVKVGLNLRKVNMEVGLEPEADENMEKHIFSSGMIQNIGPVDVSKRLFKRLRESPNAKNGTLRIWDYGYDWRLHPHLLSKKLIKFLEGLPSNASGTNGGRGALVIPHSLGGLITRHAVNMRPELFSGVIYAGVPQACVNILGPIRNGDAVLLSSRVLTAQVNFTIRTTFALLPLEGYCFLDKTTKEPYTVDYFNVDDWIKYRWSPCTDPPLPPKNPSSSGFANILKSSSLTNLQLPLRKSSTASTRGPSQSSTTATATAVNPQQPESQSQRQPPESPSLRSKIADGIQDVAGTDRTLAPQMGNLRNPMDRGQSTNSSVSTAVTIPREDAIAFLRRILPEIKRFKLELAHDESLESTNRYPPMATIYGKSTPTVYGAKVDGRDGIACADSYDDLAFASGDGVCLAREAMLPEGYRCVQGGRISSDRGHVTLLGDLNAVGRAIMAVTRGRAKGLGLGLDATDQYSGNHDTRTAQ